MSGQGWAVRFLMVMLCAFATSMAVAAPRTAPLVEQREGILIETNVTIASGSKQSTAKGRVIMDSELVSWMNVAQSPEGFMVMARRVNDDAESIELELKVVSNKKGESRVLATPVVHGSLGNPLQMVSARTDTDGNVLVNLRAQKVRYEIQRSRQ